MELTLVEVALVDHPVGVEELAEALLPAVLNRALELRSREALHLLHVHF